MSDEKYCENMKKAYQESGAFDLQMAEELAGVSYEADKIALGEVTDEKKENEPEKGKISTGNRG